MIKHSIYKQFMAFIRKEFYHVFRDRKTLLIMFVLPIVQILLFGFALTNEVKNAKLLIVNPTENVASQQIVSKIQAGKYFTITHIERNISAMDAYLKSGEIQCALIFPHEFNASPLKNNTIQIITDGTDPNFSKTVTNYLNAIIGEYMHERNMLQQAAPLSIHTEIRMLYNPELNGSMIFIPGVIALIMMIVCCTLTAVAIVKEKEFGSMEVLLVSPLKPFLALIAKALPYLALSIANLIIIMLMSRFALHVPIRGSLPLLFSVSILFIITCLAFGLVISNSTNSQSSAMLISMMGMLLPTLLFTGFLFPLENMPAGYQWFANIVPARWYFLIVNDVMIKGLSFSGIWKETLVLTGMTIALLSISMLKFKTRLQ